MFGWEKLLGPPSSRRGSSSDNVSRKQTQQEERETEAVFDDHTVIIAGMPPKKQMQQEEIVAPLDAEEREALETRLANRKNGAGRYATARPASPTVVHSSWFQNRELSQFSSTTQPRNGPTATGDDHGSKYTGYYSEMDSYYSDVPSSGYGHGFSARGYSSARVEAGMLTPSQFRQIKASARRESDMRSARATVQQSRERARRAAQQAATRQSAREAVEEARREEARRHIREREKAVATRQDLLAASARKANVQPLSLRKVGGGKAQSVRSKQHAAHQNRPSWGQGHAGGHKISASPGHLSAKHREGLSPEVRRPMTPPRRPMTPPRQPGTGKRVFLAPNDIGPGWL